MGAKLLFRIITGADIIRPLRDRFSFAYSGNLILRRGKHMLSHDG